MNRPQDGKSDATRRKEEAPGDVPPQGAPLVSIVIPTFNRASFLERCVRSVLNQTYRHLECIVVDGASQDDSVHILQRLASADSRLKYISEPDGGEAYAMNKGIALARGEIIGWQASDDFYALDAVETSVRFLLNHPGYIGVAGDGRYVDAEGNDAGRGVITHRGRMARDTITRLFIVRYKMCPVCHGCFFGWRERLQAHGGFDPAFSVTPDWEFYLRVLKGGGEIGHLPRVQYFYTLHEAMGAMKYFNKVEAQRAELYRRHGIKLPHILLRATLGRWLSYVANPYRTPFFKGLWREAKEVLSRPDG